MDKGRRKWNSRRVQLTSRAFRARLRATSSSLIIFQQFFVWCGTRRCSNYQYVPPPHTFPISTGCKCTFSFLLDAHTLESAYKEREKSIKWHFERVAAGTFLSACCTIVPFICDVYALVLDWVSCPLFVGCVRASRSSSQLFGKAEARSDCVQGLLFARPLPLSEISAHLHLWHSRLFLSLSLCVRACLFALCAWWRVSEREHIFRESEGEIQFNHLIGKPPGAT